MKNYRLVDIECRFKYRSNYLWEIVKIKSFRGENFLTLIIGRLSYLPLFLILFPGISDIGAEDRRDLLYHCLRVTARSFLARCKRINPNSGIRLTRHSSCRHEGVKLRTLSVDAVAAGKLTNVSNARDPPSWPRYIVILRKVLFKRTCNRACSSLSYVQIFNKCSWILKRSLSLKIEYIR